MCDWKKIMEAAKAIKEECGNNTLPECEECVLLADEILENAYRNNPNLRNCG